DAFGERAAFGGRVVGVGHGTDQVVETLQRARKRRRVKALAPEQAQASGLGVDLAAARARLFLKHAINQPHAGGAGDALHRQHEFGRAAGGAEFGGALQVVQPGEVALGLQGGVSGRGDVVAELVVVVEALVVNQAVNVGAAGAAELGAIRRRRAAVFANRFAPR